MDVQKQAISVGEMARMVGLSRARFYQLLGTTFPSPVYDIVTRRPFYSAELQQVCLDVRRRNCGIDGVPVLFYATRKKAKPEIPRRPRSTPKPHTDNHGDLIAGLKSLGLADVTNAQVAVALKKLFPSGVVNTEQETLRAVFLYLTRRPDLLAVEAAKAPDGASA